MEEHYIAIRTNLYYLFGEERFNILKQILSAVLFFGSSITLGVQLISEIVTIVILAVLVTKVAVFFTKKASSDIFSSRVLLENESASRRNNHIDEKQLFLILGRLLN